VILKSDLDSGHEYFYPIPQSSSVGKRGPFALSYRTNLGIQRKKIYVKIPVVERFTYISKLRWKKIGYLKKGGGILSNKKIFNE
jgi:hypothetical protein